MISSGSGEATTRRQPFSPRSSHVSPCSTSSCASSAGRNRPMGLVGFVKPGSSRSTSARVTTVADRRSTPRRSSDASSASISTMPSVAWVCAPHQSSGTGGTTAAASSFLTSRLPTCGPLPCVITTSTSLASRSATASMATSAAAIWSSTRARRLGVRHRVPAQCQQHPHQTEPRRAAADRQGEQSPARRRGSVRTRARLCRGRGSGRPATPGRRPRRRPAAAASPWSRLMVAWTGVQSKKRTAGRAGWIRPSGGCWAGTPPGPGSASGRAARRARSTTAVPRPRRPGRPRPPPGGRPAAG